MVWAGRELVEAGTLRRVSQTLLDCQFTHGNDTGALYQYQKVGPSGAHLKFGITKGPATRYTTAELAGGPLRILASGESR